MWRKPVFHIHDENWRQVKTRYEREAVALQDYAGSAFNKVRCPSVFPGCG